MTTATTETQDQPNLTVPPAKSLLPTVDDRNRQQERTAIFEQFDDRIKKKKEEIERLHREIVETEKERSETNLEMARDEQRCRIAESRREQDPVTLAVATQQAKKLVDAFDQANGGGRRQSDQGLSDRTWKIIDSVRVRLSTNDVFDDAQLVVLSVEGLITMCAKWEGARTQTPTGTEYDHELHHLFFQNRRVLRLLDEIKWILRGDDPPALQYGIGGMLAQGDSLEAIGRTLRIQHANGKSDMNVIGQMIDAGSQTQASWTAVRLYATFDFNEAWQKRQDYVPKRRGLPLTDPSSSAHESKRPGRLIGTPGVLRRQREDRDLATEGAFQTALEKLQH